MDNLSDQNLAGSIKRNVRAIVQHNVVTCPPEYTLQQATRAMFENHCSSVVIVKDDRPVGIWTEADALKINYDNLDQATTLIQDLMSTPVSTIALDASLDEATCLFRRNGLRHLIVVDDAQKLSGIITQSDVVIHQDVAYFLRMSEVSAILPPQQPARIDQQCDLPEAIAAMRESQTDCILITVDDLPVGMLTERDVVRLIALDQLQRPLYDVMSAPLISVSENMSLLSARALMERRHIRHLCVTCADECICGVVSFADVLANIEQAYVNRLREALDNRIADLEQSENSLNMAKALIDASMDGIMVTDESGTILSVNPAFTILTGYSEREALGKRPSLLSSGKQGPDFYQKLWTELKKHGSWQGEIWNRRKNGEVYPEWLTITVVHDARNKRRLYAAIFSDITERKKSEAIIENLAYYDPLTKLPNRQLLFDRLEVAMATAHRMQHGLALLFIDLDLFKRINDTLGHSVGDEVLCEVAARLRRCIREGDTVSRIGGDEMIILMTEMVSTDGIHRVVQRIFRALEKSINVAGHELHLTASLGCSIYPEDGTDRDTLLKHADTAMYRAKSNGRNSFQLYSADMNRTSMQRLSLESRLHTALGNNELFLQYQPKLELGSNRIVGMEALLRWNDREQGVIPPDQFIPAAEELGLIGKIGAWALQEACRQCKEWHDAGYEELHMSVNVSPQQFTRRDLADDVEKALSSSGLPPAKLDLEITESCAIQNIDDVVEPLNRLREQGITVSMDDFGTGYSSLSMLSQLPLDQLKVDRSFIAGIPDRVQDQELVSTMVLMAHNLGLNVVAEGIETCTQHEYLKQIGCDQGQGFLFNRPLAPEDISTLLLH